MVAVNRRPPLIEVPLSDVWPPRPRVHLVTITEGQEWSADHQWCYEDGWTILELDEDENVVRALRKPEVYRRPAKPFTIRFPH